MWVAGGSGSARLIISKHSSDTDCLQTARALFRGRRVFGGRPPNSPRTVCERRVFSYNLAECFGSQRARGRPQGSPQTFRRLFVLANADFSRTAHAVLGRGVFPGRPKNGPRTGCERGLFWVAGRLGAAPPTAPRLRNSVRPWTVRRLRFHAVWGRSVPGGRPSKSPRTVRGRRLFTGCAQTVLRRRVLTGRPQSSPRTVCERRLSADCVRELSWVAGRLRKSSPKKSRKVRGYSFVAVRRIIREQAANAQCSHTAHRFFRFA